MRCLTLLSFLVLSSCLVSFGQTDQSSKKGAKSKQQEPTEQQLILQTEEALRQAKVDNNTMAIDEIYADEYKGINQYGVVTDKARGKATFANRKNLVLNLDSVSATLVSESEAYTKGLQTEDGVQMRFERKYAKQNGKWRVTESRQKMLEYKGTKGIGKYIINGHLSGADGVAVSLMMTNTATGRSANLNAAIVKEGSFTMEGNAIEYPQMAFLTTPGKNERVNFFLENSEITITGNLDSLSKVKITGSKTQDEFASFLKSNDELRAKSESKFKEMFTARQNKDTVRIKQLTIELEPIRKEMLFIQEEFVRKNPASYALPVILQSLSNSTDPSDYESLVNSIDPDVARTHLIIMLKSRINETKAVAVGKKAPDFALNDVNGSPVPLSSKLGPKLLLVDFWAAWCAPCRAENPNVVKVYNEFKDKGFDVFGVSLDRSKEEWIQAIAKDNLTWTQVSDLLFWNSAAAKLYSVRAIPANFLLDQNGTIIAKNIRGEALYNKVKESLSQK